MIPSLYYALFISLCIAFACSVIQFRQRPAHLKILSVLLGLDVLNEYLATFGMHYLRSWFNLKNNLAIYNSFMLVEFILFACFFFNIIKINWFTKFIIAFIILFPLLWIISVFIIFGIYGWNSYIQIAGSTFIVVAGLAYFYQLYIAEELISLTKNSEFWIVAGLIIFFMCNLPFMGMLNYLINNYQNTAEKLLSVLQIFNIIMYSLISYAYLCRIKITKSSLTS